MLLCTPTRAGGCSPCPDSPAAAPSWAAAPTSRHAPQLPWQGYISTADYEGKKTQLVLFINGRSGEACCRCCALAGMAAQPGGGTQMQQPGLCWRCFSAWPGPTPCTALPCPWQRTSPLLPAVECTPLKRALEASYAAVLPKACKPFLFLVRGAGC